MHFPALALELEAHLAAVDASVLVAHRREADGAVIARVLLVAHADQAGLQQLDYRCEHLLSRQALKAEVGVDPISDRG